jgi:single-strand DNA-binding protein
LSRGDRVILSGRLQQRSYETKEGEKRTVMELTVEEIGPSLKWATAKVNRITRGGSGATSQRPANDAADPWGSAPQTGSAGGWSDEPPF